MKSRVYSANICKPPEPPDREEQGGGRGGGEGEEEGREWRAGRALQANTTSELKGEKLRPTADYSLCDSCNEH